MDKEIKKINQNEVEVKTTKVEVVTKSYEQILGENSNYEYRISQLQLAIDDLNNLITDNNVLLDTGISLKEVKAENIMDIK